MLPTMHISLDILDLILEVTHVDDILNASRVNRDFYHLAQRHIRRKYKARFGDVELSDTDPKADGSAYQFLVRLSKDKRIAQYVTSIYLKDWSDYQKTAWKCDLAPIQWSSGIRKDKCVYPKHLQHIGRGDIDAICLAHHHYKNHDKNAVAAKYSRFDGLLGSITCCDLSQMEWPADFSEDEEQLTHVNRLHKLKAALYRHDDDAAFALLLHVLPKIEEIYISYPGSLYLTTKLLEPFSTACHSTQPNLHHPILKHLNKISIIGSKRNYGCPDNNGECSSDYGENVSDHSETEAGMEAHIRALIGFPSVRTVEINQLNADFEFICLGKKHVTSYSINDCIAPRIDSPHMLIRPGLEELLWEPRAGNHGSWTAANYVLHELAKHASQSVKRLRIGSCCNGYGSGQMDREIPLNQLTVLEILDIDAVHLLDNNGSAKSLVDVLPESIKLLKIKEIPDVHEADNLFYNFAKKQDTVLPNLEKVIVSSDCEHALVHVERAVEAAGIELIIIDMKEKWYVFEDC